MQKTIAIIILALISNSIFGQANYEKFKQLFKANDTAKIRTLLTEWERANPNDPELYTSAINYHYSISKQEEVSLDKHQRSEESYQLTDSTGKVAGYLNSNIGYDNNKLNEAIKYANIGIDKFPNRLDIRFGKCYLLQQIGDLENFTKEIIKTVEYSQTNKNNWLWTENKKQEKGQVFLLETIQSYLKELYDTEDDKLLPNMIKIGETTLKYYPNTVEILSTTSVALMLTKQYDKAIQYLKQAEQLNPKDYIVLNNIAQAYKLKGDKINAIKYYDLAAKYGDEQVQRQAKENIEKLKKVN
jgi:tetratricopeptide (TPR) repeat protein